MNKEERQAALEAICRLEPDAKNYREEYPTQCESADGDAMIVRAALQSATECKNMNDILLAMSESHAGSLNDAKEAIAAIYAAGMMIVSQDPHTKLERVDLDQFLLKSVNHYCDGNNRAISLIKAKYGELYAEVK